GLGHGQAGVGMPDLNAGLGGDVAEAAAAVVVIEVGESALEVSGRAVGPANLGQLVGRAQVQFRRPTDVIADEQVEPAVVVIINPGRAGAPEPRVASHVCFTGHLAEFAAAFI